MIIEVVYFALLSEQAGRPRERIEHAGGLRDLYAACTRRHRFTLPESSVRAAVNDEFVAWDHPLQDQDVVVFMPPVRGG